MKRSNLVLLFAALLILPALSQAADSPAPSSWTDKVKFSGDIRYRHEFISTQTLNADGQKTRIYDRNRQRLRARLGLQVTVNPVIDAHFRLGTSTFISNANNPGAGDPISTNQDMSGGFSPKPLWIDRAYVDYHPCAHFSARAGKQQIPFEHTDLVWDGDLNVEGLTALFSHKVHKHELFLRLGGYWAGERGPSGYAKHALDQGLFEGQLGAKGVFDKLSCGLALAYIDYGNVKGNPTLFAPNNGFGNSLMPISGRGNDSLGYAYDFNIINVTAQAKYKFSKIEPGLILDFATNSGNDKKDPAYDKKLNTSWLAGATVKFMKLPLDWDLGYNYRVQQRDAVVGAFTDSDPVGGGTNFNGHKLALGFTVLPSTRLAFTYFKNVKDPDNKNSNKHYDYDRIQGDLEVKF
jgi:hypothetical protein